MRYGEAAMQFRWVVAIVLWTILSGPVFTRPANATNRTKAVSASADAGVTPSGEKGTPSR
jgi:hypothetical protein